jgi:hypothetical protein
MVAPLLAATLTPIIGKLFENGLTILGNAALAKGKNVIEDKLGIDLESSMQSEEGLLKLKQLEMDHEEFLVEVSMQKKEQELREQEMLLKTDSDARNMQVEALRQDDVFSKRFLYYFAIGWCGFAAIYMLGITFSTIPETSVRFADTILGFVLGTIVSQIVAFFFGSSHRSANKDKTIQELSKGGLK